MYFMLSTEKLIDEVLSLPIEERAVIADCLLILQIADVMEETNLSKTLLAQKMQTSRSQLDRLLDAVTDRVCITI